MNEFDFGWLMYANRLSYFCCGTDELRRGWMAANQAEAMAEVQLCGYGTLI